MIQNGGRMLKVVATEINCDNMKLVELAQDRIRLQSFVKNYDTMFWFLQKRGIVC